MIYYVLQALLNFLGYLENWACELGYTLLQLAVAPLPTIPTNATLATLATYCSLLNLWFPLDTLCELLAGFLVSFIVYFCVKLVVRLF